MKVHFELLIGSQRAEGNNNGKLFGKEIHACFSIDSVDIDKTFFARTNFVINSTFLSEDKVFSLLFTEKCKNFKVVNTG